MRLIVCLIVLLSWSIASNLFAQNDVNIFMIARNTGKKILANSDTIRVFGFAGNLNAQPSIPGPTIYANEGDSVHIDLWNVSQGAPHTIHLHGLDVNQQNDGVPHLSFDIDHMAHGYYHFKAPHAGTYLYHCHVASTIHVQAGMYGLVVIKPSDGSMTTWNGGYTFDQELSYFLSEIDTTWHNDTILDHEHDTTTTIHYVTIPKYNPQFFLINGYSDQQLAEQNISYNSSVGSVNYVRLSNLGYYGSRVIFPSGLNAVVIDSDGRPLPETENSDTVLLYPGERYGVLCSSTSEFTDSIRFEYFNLNTKNVAGVQHVPVTIEGFVSIDELPIMERFTVLPNPFEESINVQFSLEESEKIQFTVSDESGKIIEKVKFKKYAGDNTVKLGGSISESGIYYILIETESEGKIVKKIVKL